MFSDGSSSLDAALAHRLRAAGIAVTLLSPDGDGEARDALARTRPAAAAIVSRDDAFALRLTLLCARVAPEVALWTTLFDRTVAHRLEGVAGDVTIVAAADRAADALVGVCTRAGVRPVTRWRTGARLVDDALRLLVRASVAIVGLFVLQVVSSMIALHESAVDAVYFGARTLATITDTPRADGAADWFKLLSTVEAAAAVVLLAIVTATLVRVFSRPRLTTLLGRRRAPGRDHVIVVGIGQVGFRLGVTLRRMGVPVLGVELRDDTASLRRVSAAGVPVALGNGEDRAMLDRVGVRRCAALVAVTSDDLVNVAIGLAATDLRPGLPLVLRLGDGEVAAETESLLHLGHICDVHDAVAQSLARQISERLLDPRRAPPRPPGAGY